MTRLSAPIERAPGRAARGARAFVALFLLGQGLMPVAAAPVPEDVAALVPPGTGALVYVPSPMALENELRAVVERVAPESAAKVDITTMVSGMLGPAAASWDTSRPLAIAATPPGAGALMPSVTVVIPVDDVDAALRAFGVEPGGAHPLLTVSGSYIGFALVPGPGQGGSDGRATILDDPLDGDISIRLDVGRLMASYGPFVEQMLTAFTDSIEAGAAASGSEGMPVGQMMAGLPQMLLDGLNAAERLDITLALEGDRAEAGYALAVREGTRLARDPDDPGGARRVAGYLPADAPAFAWFAGVFEEWMVPWDTDAPETGAAEELVTYLETLQALYAALGPSAAAMGVDDEGFWLAGVAEPTVPSDQMNELLHALVDQPQVMYETHGVSVTDEGTTTLAGVELHVVSFQVDLEHLADSEGEDAAQLTEARRVFDMFFAERMRCRYGFVDGVMVYGLGAADHLERVIATARRHGEVPAPLSRAFDRTSIPLNYALQCDLRELATQVVARVRAAGNGDVPDVPAGGPVRVIAWNGHAATRYQGGLDLDVAGVAELIAYMGEVFPKHEETPDTGGDD